MPYSSETKLCMKKLSNEIASSYNVLELEVSSKSLLKTIA